MSKSKKTIILIIFCFKFTSQIFGQYIENDFSPAFTREAHISYSHMQGDKIVIGGRFNQVNQFNTNGIVILNEDGTVYRAPNNEILNQISYVNVLSSTDSLALIKDSDQSRDYLYNFVSNEVEEITFDSYLYSGLISPDNNYIFGIFYEKSLDEFVVKKYNLDGTLDENFDIVRLNNWVSGLTYLNDGSLIVFGYFDQVNDTDINKMVKISNSGKVDDSFNAGEASNNIEKVYENNVGDLFVSGYITSFDNNPVSGGLIKLNNKGQFDNSFSLGPTGNTFSRVTDIKFDNNNKILVTGYSISSESMHKVIRIRMDGSFDSSFNMPETSNEISYFTGPSFLESLSNNNTLLLGNFLSIDKNFAPSSGVINSNGQFDGYNVALKSPGHISTSAKQTDGKILVSGNFGFINDKEIYRIARISQNGDVDNSFMLDSNIHIQDLTNVILQNDNKIIISGYFEVGNSSNIRQIIRLLPDGNLDYTFDADIYISSDVPIAYDYRTKDVYALNPYVKNDIIRTDSLGAKDLNFSTENVFPNDFRITSIFPDINGEIFVSGYTYVNGSLTGGELYKINKEGILIEDFVVNNIPQSITDLKRISNGTIIYVGGFVTSFSSTDPNPIYFINNEGEIIDQTSFATRGANNVSDNVVFEIVLNKDSTEALLLGRFEMINEHQSGQVAHINLSGTVDKEFTFYVKGQTNTGIIYDQKLSFFGNFSILTDSAKYSAGQINLKNYIPDILGTSSELSILEDSVLLVEASILDIVDLDDTDHNLIALPGDNYSVSNNNEIRPDTNYFGNLSIPIRVTDTKDTSDIYNIELVIIAVNDAPSLVDYTEFEIFEDSSFNITLNNLIIEDPDSEIQNLTFTIFESEHYTIENQETIVPEENYFGELNIHIVLSDGIDESDSYYIPIEVLAVNDAPIIQGITSEIAIAKNFSYEFKIEDINIFDPDNSIEDLALVIFDGENYTHNDNVITPDQNFGGTLSVNFSVNDGADSSNKFVLPIIVSSILSNKDLSSFDQSGIFPNPTNGIVNIQIDDAYIGNLIIIIHDSNGKEIANRSHNKTSQSEVFSLNTQEFQNGLYLLKIKSENDRFAESHKIVVKK
ncbi:hypothetical protein GCM10027429_26620 [Marivirga atlantica]|uniref:T9SS type A sorting domain-containing protein n=1 Tax=Marivirga atlantica TaxID=1548457 RepID=A0A937DKP6_9BACT|nr:T9SS type A sorting domain-containing protein [Marivirga atlantica]MBL0766264.1 T9SS type A sorting domain-containing protein [Marivirga atlantica]